MSPKRIFKSVLAVLIIAVAVWAFQTPQGGDGGARTGGLAMAVGDSDAPFEITIFPGWPYVPGTRPGGMGEPLEGFLLVAKDFVKLHPDTRVVFRNVPAEDREWIVTQLLSDQAPDIVVVNVEDAWADIEKGWWLPLDQYLEKPNPFIPAGQPGSNQWWDQFKYQAISRGKAGPDGKMYCLSYDMTETAIYYNKTKFDELGIAPPETWDQFIQMQQKIKDAGYIPFVTVVENIADWAIDLLLDQFYADILPGIDLVKDPLREQYLQGYLDWDEVAFLRRKGFFTSQDPRYREVYRVLKDWRAYWNQDLGHRTMDRIRPFVRQEGLMTWDGSWLVQQLALDKTLDFEWSVFYLPPITTKTSTYGPGVGVPMCVISGSAMQFSVTKCAFRDTRDPATSEQLKRVIRFLQFACVPDNARRVVNESLQFIPNIVGVEPREPLLPFHEILQRRYTTTKFRYVFDLKFVDILVRMLSLYLNDGCDLDEFLARLDPFFAQSAERAIRSRKPDLVRLEKRWNELAPLRAGMRDLPNGAR